MNCNDPSNYVKVVNSDGSGTCNAGFNWTYIYVGNSTGLDINLVAYSPTIENAIMTCKRNYQECIILLVNMDHFILPSHKTYIP